MEREAARARERIANMVDWADVDGERVCGRMNVGNGDGRRELEGGGDGGGDGIFRGSRKSLFVPSLS